MDVILGLMTAMILFVYGVSKGINTLIPLSIVLCIFLMISTRRGISIKESIASGWEAGKRSLGVLTIFMLIGVIVSLWMISGTVPGLVHYGANLIHPNLFILTGFLLCAGLSILLGTSFGTVGTMGVALIVMARAGDGNVFMVAGAILSGIYVGDRCSPMSSSAHLVATVTETDVYVNIKNMMRSSWIPLGLTSMIYLVLSIKNPVNYTNSSILIDIANEFVLSPIVLLPALVIVILSIVKVNVKKSMMVSIVVAAIIAFTVQEQPINEIIKSGIVGFHLPVGHPLATIIQGGGAQSMVELAVIVFLSSALTGVIERANMLDFIEPTLSKLKTKSSLFFSTMITSMISSMVGCTQTLAVMLTKVTMEKSYTRLGQTKETLALHIEDTAIIMAGIVPWNIGVLVPLTTLGVGMEALLYNVYLLLLPLIHWGMIVLSDKRGNKNSRLTIIEHH